ncbi:hypothetical protein P3102_07055 [Amycolatopsis sp. QT-25]|uniref:hypothetical protein n=1 Tax=Amycolatopsis sp. QT-25 TaxID=3034022 RepID=UPI0023EC1754|nr:hypothetical protein [Amycolatopsis sp. QT-25]WET80986.1 hypothetical protein P3102_07055 [Amycolatopsis sp. QT-25]
MIVRADLERAGGALNSSRKWQEPFSAAASPHGTSPTSRIITSCSGESTQCPLFPSTGKALCSAAKSMPAIGSPPTAVGA